MVDGSGGDGSGGDGSGGGEIYMAEIPIGHHIGYAITSQEYLLEWDGCGEGWK